MGNHKPFFKSIESLFKKMKLFCLLAVASASTTEWLMNQWWAEAKNVFNFAQNNFEKFQATIDSVPDDKWDPLWNFCEGTDELDVEHLTKCAKKIGDWAKMPADYQQYMYDFGAKYFSYIDIDKSGTLSKTEFEYLLAGAAAVDARVILVAFDADGKGLLTEPELAKWEAMVEGQMEAWGWDLTAEKEAAMEQAWNDAQVNGNPKTASMIEIAHFLVNTWNVFLQ